MCLYAYAYILLVRIQPTKITNKLLLVNDEKSLVVYTVMDEWKVVHIYTSVS